MATTTQFCSRRGPHEGGAQEEIITLSCMKVAISAFLEVGETRRAFPEKKLAWNVQPASQDPYPI